MSSLSCSLSAMSADALSAKARRSLRRHQRRYGTRAPHTDAIWLRELLPIMSHRLIAQLTGEDAPAAPYGVELISVDAWEAAMRLRCEGASPKAALHQAGISRSLFDAYCRCEPSLRIHWQITRGIARRRWCPSEEVFDDIANSALSVRTICAQRNISYQRFLRLSQDPFFEQQYLSAKDAQQQRLCEANEGIVDAALKGASSRKTLRQAMHIYNVEATKIRGLRPRRINARIKQAVRDPAGRLEAAVARRRAAKA
jgi:hypothetical protein